MTDRSSPALTCDDVREVAGAFVLGALTPYEEAAVRDHLASCADPHPEIIELGSVVPVLAGSVAIVEPSDGLKSRVMAAAAADLAARDAAGTVAAAQAAAAVAAPVTAAAARNDAPAAPATPIPFPTSARRSASPATWALRIAAVLVIGVLAGWNLMLQGQLSDTQRYQQAVATVFEVARQPGSVTAIMTGDEGTGPTGVAAISAAGDMSLAMRDLAPTSGNQVYETWVIGDDGAPVPVGSFQVGSAGTASFTTGGLPSQDGIVVALTLEPGPGATTPTLPLVSSGTATVTG